MRTIIAGSRSIVEYDRVLEAVVNSGFRITQIVSGGAKGVDTLGENIAKDFNIPLAIFLAEWDMYGKRAGPIRNELMAHNADALIAVWDGYSAGTKNMINTAKRLGLKVYIDM